MRYYRDCGWWFLRYSLNCCNGTTERITELRSISCMVVSLLPWLISLRFLNTLRLCLQLIRIRFQKIITRMLASLRKIHQYART